MDYSGIIYSYFPRLTPIQKSQFDQLGQLYHEWNQKINVISRKDIDYLYERHVLHSLSIAKFIQFNPGASILDAGTGGGFPGIPLAILFPESHFMLVDSIGKKIKVVESIATSLDLKNIQAEQNRVELLNSTYDFVVSRAVTRISTFYNWVAPVIGKQSINSRSNGIIYLKGGDLFDELEEMHQYYEVFEIKNYFSESFFDTKKIIYIPVIK